jgi:NADH-quinone oxidoreductase subunit L
MTTDLAVRLILLLPLAGAVFCGVLPLFLTGMRRQETLIGAVGTLMVAIPFGLAAMLFLGESGGHGAAHVSTFYTWMEAGDLSVSFAYRVDALSLLMTLIVTGVGGVIHLYSVGYMHGDEGFWRFFAYLNLFIFAMLNLVLANNLPVLFLGWEGVGLCSYLLIGFWYKDLANTAAANKAFIVNRIGDFAFLLAMFLLFREVGSLDFGALLGATDQLSQASLNWAVLLLFVGATGKSAQIPLFVWLPDAMAGPTPVSALIHAATMVTSGLYLLARLSELVLASQVMWVIAVVGALTAIMGATVALTQNDIKKVLAYSTVSQLGYMFMAAGVGAFFVAIFHVLTHAFFKGCLFLCSGSVIHGMHDVEHALEHDADHSEDATDGLDQAEPHGVEGEKDMRRREAGADSAKNPVPYDGPFDPQDMRTMGGLARYMPSTRWTYFLSTIAIAGFPLFSGFFSKDEILFKAFEYGYDGHFWAWGVWIVGVVTAFLTALYMMRSYVLTFEGRPRWPRADEGLAPHESPATMTIPLWILAFGAVFAGYLGMPAVAGDMFPVENWIHHYLGAEYGGPVAEAHLNAHVPAIYEWTLIGLGAVIAVAGITFAWTHYREQEGLAYDGILRDKLGGLYRLWQGKYFVDEGYDKGVVRPIIGGSEKGLAPFDAKIVDGAVNGLARMTNGASGFLKYIQTGVVQNYALAIALGVVIVVGLMFLAGGPL